MIKLMYLSVLGMIYESLTVTSLTLRWSKQNYNESCFPGTNTTEAANSILASEINPSCNTCCIPISVNCLVSGTARYGALWNGLVLLAVSSILCFSVSIQHRCSSHMFSDLDCSCRNTSLSVLYLSGMAASLPQTMVSLVSSCRFSCSWFAVGWSLTKWDWWWTRLTHR